MGYPDDTENKDLHLRCRLLQDARWEELPSAGRYAVPLRTHKSSNGTIYGQGVFLNAKGKELSLANVAALIDVHGQNAIYHLEGEFAIAVDDTRHGVWCATDPSAMIPLYYKLKGNELVITTCPENMTVSSADDLDLECIVAFLNCGYPWGDMTLLKDWKALRPGHMIYIGANNKASITGYFDPEGDESVEGYKSPEEFIQSIDRSLESIASRHDKVLVPLSGGIDSRLIAVRCHALGIPFEAITFVANVPNGADFDVSTHLVKAFGVKHHRWQWNPSTEDCMKNFEDLCYATGGMNDAFTSYPDGMGFFGEVAEEFDCVLRGDHVVGWGSYTGNFAYAAWLLGIKFEDSLDWALRPDYRNRVNLVSMVERLDGISLSAKGNSVNKWRHSSYRKNRSPRYVMPNAHLQSRFIAVANPLQSKEIVARISRTDTNLRDNKSIARRALAYCSPENIKSIPFTSKSTWRGGEPLLNVPRSVVQQMIEVVARPSILSGIVDESAVIANFEAFLSQGGRQASKSILGDIKKMLKNALPAKVRAAYEERNVPKLKTPPYMIFKRYFAMKVYLDRLLKSQN